MTTHANENLQKEYVSEQNYPNPFNPSTRIPFSFHNSGMVSLKVFDLIGQEVASLVNENLDAGNHEVVFEASSLSSGMYFYRLQAGPFVATRSLIFLR